MCVLRAVSFLKLVENMVRDMPNLAMYTAIC